MASQDSKARAVGVAETDESNARFGGLRYAAFTCHTGFTDGCGRARSNRSGCLSTEGPLNESVARELLELAYKSFGAGRGVLSGSSSAGP